MLLFLYRLLRGYLYVRVKTNYAEKLLNLAAVHNLEIWRVSISGELLYFKISVDSFKKLRAIKRNIPMKIHITKKAGLPFFVHKNRYRYGFLVGIIMFFIILEFLSGFVWNIFINNNSTVSDEKILSALKNIGVYEGVKIKNINPENERNELLIKLKELSWAAINIEGSTLTVDVVETKFADNDEKTPSNLVANFDGVIKKIEVLSGNTQVKVGDAVRKGDLLVSGFFDYSDGANRAVRSKGKIYAEVIMNYEENMSCFITESVKNGKVKRKKALSFFGYKIPLFIGKIAENYIPQKTHLNSNKLKSPIHIIKRNFYLTDKVSYKISKEQAKSILTENFKKEIEEKYDDILHTKLQFFEAENQVKMKAEYKVLIDISLEEKLLLSTSNY